MKKVSIIIPTYRPSEYIIECLASLIAQTMPYEDFEVIVVLNGCDEPYRTMILEHASIEGFPLFLMQTDLPGVSNARNMALDCANGEYICFLDDDDYVSACYLEELYQHASRDVVSLCRPIAFKDDGTILKNYRITDVYDTYASRGMLHFQVARKFFSGPCMKLIHRDIISDRRFDCTMSIGEDSLFMFLISDRLNKVSFTSSRAIYYRRIREGSLTRNKRPLHARIANALRLISKELEIYARCPRRYKISFLTTRVLGAIKAIVLG